MSKWNKLVVCLVVWSSVCYSDIVYAIDFTIEVQEGQVLTLGGTLELLGVDFGAVISNSSVSVTEDIVVSVTQDGNPAFFGRLQPFGSDAELIVGGELSLGSELKLTSSTGSGSLAIRSVDGGPLDALLMSFDSVVPFFTFDLFEEGASLIGGGKLDEPVSELVLGTTQTQNPIPEPSTYLLFLLSLGICLRRK